MKQDLTPKQQAVLDYIKDEIEKNGKAPTRREMAAEFNFSLNTAQRYVETLLWKGHIQRMGGMTRALSLL